MRIPYEEVLDFFCWGLETFSRRDCGLILAGVRMTDSEWRANQLLARLERQRLIERRGRGTDARFAITLTGRKRVATLEPSRAWNKPWDGKWRVFSYDLPETRRKDRKLLWHELHARKFGLLQRSVWVWPHDVEAMLLEMVEAHGIPECFCGFESGRLFLCNDREVVNSAWDFEEIGRRHQVYLKRLVADPAALDAARDLSGVARVARAEREAYAHAFSFDPLLPRSLWPSGYRGARVEEAHQKFRAALCRRLHELAG